MLGRRQFMISGAALGAVRITTAQQIPAPPIEEDGGFVKPYAFQNLATWITPSRQFFIRNHFPQPSIDVANWTLSVEGDVDKPLKLTYEDLLAMPAESLVATLECTGNPAGGRMISTGKWSGPSLQSLLELTGVAAAAQEVILEGADEGFVEEIGEAVRFARSIPLSKANHEATLLAHTLNDAPLPAALGFPLRAVIPGWYAAGSVKWLSRVIVTRRPFEGFFQSRRYVFLTQGEHGLLVTPAREMKVKSQIARPLPNILLSQRPYTIRGAAWSGGAEIQRVDVTLNGGEDWEAAELGAESAPFAWRLWEFPWPEPKTGHYSIGARAVDSRNRVQPLQPDAEELTAYGENHVAWVNVRVR